MKTAQLFWGFFFLTVGALIFFVKYEVITADWYFVWDLWPLLLIFWGLSVILKDSKAKPILGILFGVFLGIVIYGSLNYLSGTFDSCDNHNDFEIRTFTEEYDPSTKYANLDIKAGAGTFLIKRNTDHLVKGIVKGNLVDYYFNSDQKDSTANVEFELEKHNLNFFGKNSRNRLEVLLNNNPIWDLNLKIGAAKAKFDLSSFKVRNVVLGTGATHTYLTFGDKLPETYFSVEMGVSSLEIEIPRSSGCKLVGDMVLVAKNLKGFIKNDSGIYITENYFEADKKIILDINGGVSSLKIRRY